MMTDVVRKSLGKIRNRFELVVVTAERCRQLMNGAPPTVENPARDRLTRIAMQEIISGRILREGDGWKVDRPPLPQVASPPPAPSPDDLLLFRPEKEESAAKEDEEE